MIQDISDGDFDSKVLKCETPVFVDFWAEWCGPCKAIHESIEDLAERYAGRMKVVRVNADQNPQAVQQFAVRSLPTLMIFREGQPVSQIIGAQSPAALRKMVEDALN